jgi:hypothetical protein
MLAEILEQALRDLQAKEKLAAAPVVAPVTCETIVANDVPIVSPNTIPAGVLPSEKQIAFYKVLVAGKKLTDDQRKALLEALPFANRRSMTASIQYLTGLPWEEKRPFIPYRRQVARPVAPTVKVAQGYYAIVSPYDNILKFFQVRTPNKGKWNGYVFVSSVSGENKLNIRDRATREAILEEIAKNPTEALKRFGQEIGECGHCRKQLTDAESRMFGIGPVCRKKLGL